VWDFKNGNTGDAVVGVAVNNVIKTPLVKEVVKTMLERTLDAMTDATKETLKKAEESKAEKKPVSTTPHPKAKQ
jgi:hypothetical protein